MFFHGIINYKRIGRSHMKRICPHCQHILKDNCYIQDKGVALSYPHLIIKEKNYKKSNHELKSCYCPQCGYVELYIDLNNDSKVSHITDNPQDLFVTAKKYAQEYNQRIEKEKKEQETKKADQKRILNLKKKQKLHQQRLQKKAGNQII